MPLTGRVWGVPEAPLEKVGVDRFQILLYIYMAWTSGHATHLVAVRSARAGRRAGGLCDATFSTVMGCLRQIERPWEATRPARWANSATLKGPRDDSLVFPGVIVDIDTFKRGMHAPKRQSSVPHVAPCFLFYRRNDPAGFPRELFGGGHSANP